MSCYYSKAYHPLTHDKQEAYFIDDYYGRHKYSIKFSDDNIYPINDCLPKYVDYGEDFSDSLFLGCGVNPTTKKHYDFWLVKTNDARWSVTSHHGKEDSEYGSNPIFHPSDIDRMIEVTKDSKRDFTWGIYHAHLRAKEYFESLQSTE